MKRWDPKGIDFRWREHAGGSFVAQTSHFHLIVFGGPVTPGARYVVLSRQLHGAAAVRGYGTAFGCGAAMRAAEEMAARLLSERRRRLVIVVVDDDAEACGAIADTLRDEGYAAIESSCGEGALRRLERISRPVLLVTDIDLSGEIEGFELAATVRSLWPATRILFIGSDRPPERLPPGEEFLATPFSAARLLERISDLAADIPSEKLLVH